MIYKYYSSWIITLSTLWYLGYLLKVPLVRYIDPYYCLQFICYGFVFFILYLKYIKHYEFNNSLLAGMIAVHFIPLAIIYKLPRGKYTTETLIVSLFLYTMYLGYLGTDVYTVYLEDDHPKDWQEIKETCRLNNGNNLPICIIDKLFNIFNFI